MEHLNVPVSTVPFVQRRIVQWGECDPAGIVYTPRFLDFVLEAMEGWQRQVLGLDWTKLNTELAMGMPVVHAELDFHSPLRGGDELDLEVIIARLGRSSIAFRVEGRVRAERPAFTCALVAAMVDKSHDRAIPIPPRYRQRIEAYRQACAGLAEA